MTNSYQAHKKRVVGFAILAEKAKKHLTSELLQQASAVGIEIRAIDPELPIAEQGPFDLILHKCRDSGLRDKLAEFLKQHPATKLYDSLDAVAALQNRRSMLAALTEPVTLHPAGPGARAASEAKPDLLACAAPVQVPLQAGCTEDEAFAAIEEAGLPFPLLAKPFWTDGRQGSHSLALLEGAEGLRRLVQGTGPPGVDLPVMLQPFIEHGGCLFKVYVLGCSVTVANRPSLQIPPEEEDVKAQRTGIQTVSRVSAHNSTSPMGCHRVRPPPGWLLDQLASELRQRLNLQMFNFDMIRPTRKDSPGGRGADFLIVDINYFPGYEKLPNHAEMLVGFLQSLLEPGKDQQPEVQALGDARHVEQSDSE